MYDMLFKQVVERFMYLNATRNDLMCEVSLISRFMVNPIETHYFVTKRILRYLRGTTELCIFYKKGENTNIIAYIDNDFARDLDDRKSTYGFMFSLGSGEVSWSSKNNLTLSTTKAEYIVVASCACQCIWIKIVLETLGFKE